MPTDLKIIKGNDISPDKVAYMDNSEDIEYTPIKQNDFGAWVKQDHVDMDSVRELRDIPEITRPGRVKYEREMTDQERAAALVDLTYREKGENVPMGLKVKRAISNVTPEEKVVAEGLTSLGINPAIDITRGIANMTIFDPKETGFQTIMQNIYKSLVEPEKSEPLSVSIMQAHPEIHWSIAAGIGTLIEFATLYNTPNVIAESFVALENGIKGLTLDSQMTKMLTVLRDTPAWRTMCEKLSERYGSAPSEIDSMAARDLWNLRSNKELFQSWRKIFRDTTGVDLYGIWGERGSLRIRDDIIAGGQIYDKNILSKYRKFLNVNEKEDLRIFSIRNPISIKDVFGDKHVLAVGENVFIYPLQNNKYLIKDGDYFVAQKNQADTLLNKKSWKLGEKEAMQGEEGVEEVVKGGLDRELDRIDKLLKEGKISVKEHDKMIDELPESMNRDILKYKQYQLPGGENYREVLFTAPTEPEIEPMGQDEVARDMYGKSVKDLTYDQLRAVNNQYLRENGITKPQTFKSSHWDEPNVISHARINDRIVDGKKILFIEEIQSDWAREARQDSTKPQHALLKNWQEFTLRRLIDKAVKEGYDGIAWTTGEQQADRYDLSKQVGEIKSKVYPNQNNLREVEINLSDSGYINLSVKPDGSIQHSTRTEFDGKKLEDVIGKDVSKKILESGDVSLSGKDLKIGGEWAKNLYDKQIPNILKDLTGGEITSISIDTSKNVSQHWKYDGDRNWWNEDETINIQKSVVDKKFRIWDYVDSHSPKKLKVVDTYEEAKKVADEYISKRIDNKSQQPYLALTPKVKVKLSGQPIAGGKSSLDRKKELLDERLNKVEQAKNSLEYINAERELFKGRIKKYADGYLSEELSRVPKHYITKSDLGITIDEAMDEAMSLGKSFNNEYDFISYLINLDKSRKEYISIINENKPKLVSKRETTLLKELEKAMTAAEKSAESEMKKVFKESEKIYKKSQRKAYLSGKKDAIEERKKRYFGENITKEQRSQLYLMAKNKGLYYMDFKGKPHDKLKGLLSYYRGASFDQFKKYISELTGTPENPPQLIKMFGDIDKDAEFISMLNKVTDKWVDINQIEIYSLDPFRIIEKVSRMDSWDDNLLADNTVNVISAADEAFFDRKVKELKSLEKVKGNIREGSKESANIMIKFEKGIEMTPIEKKVTEYLRGKYDDFIVEANMIRNLIGKSPIPYRKDYMTHIVEQNLLTDFFKGSDKDMSSISQSQLDAIRNGDYTKGNMPFNRFAQRRMTDKTKYDAIGNYLAYLDTILKEIYYAPAIAHARKFIRYALIKQPNAYKAIDRLLNDLAGKKSIVDQNMIGTLANNKAIKYIRSQIAKNALIMNLNFYLTNASNFTVSYDQLGNYMNIGIMRFLGNSTWREFAFKKSVMLKGRSIDPDIDFSVYKNIEKFINSINEFIEFNNVGSTFCGAYAYAIDILKYPEKKAILYADAIARRTQVGYKKYELNAWMRSNTGMLMSQFQSWSFNAMNHLIYDLGLGNIPKNIASIFTGSGKDKINFKGFFYLLISSLIVNEAYEKAGLRKPYDSGAAVPSVAGINSGRYTDIGPVRVLNDIYMAFAGKKSETRRKYAIRAASILLPFGGTQLSRFTEGKIFPSNKKSSGSKRAKSRSGSRTASKGVSVEGSLMNILK